MKKVLLMMTISALGSLMLGCSFSFSTNSNSTANNTPANKASNTNAAKPATNTNASNTDSKPKEVLKDEKLPTDGKGKKVKNNPVPDSWIDIYDEQRGYSFSVPEGTTGGSDSNGGVDVYVAQTPAPSEIGVFVLAFKDKTLSKDDLLDTAKKFIEGMSPAGKATVTVGALKAESEDYSIADAAVKTDLKSNKARILVGTDVTDNYIMILVCENEEKFAANEKVIDEIWGSFEMWSGGASNN
jgi:hypothetical protein